MPFLQLTSSHIAQSHLSRPSGESSKIVPTLMENCRFGCVPLHSQILRVERNRTSLLPQVGQMAPSGQRRAITYSRQKSASEKQIIASCRVFGSMAKYARKQLLSQ